MAQYIFVKTRQSATSAKVVKQLEQVCDLLTPVALKGKSQNTVAVWPNDSKAFYAIQNSESVAKPAQDSLVIGWLQPSISATSPSEPQSSLYNSEFDGAYAVINNSENELSFFNDQLGSRMLWYYLDEDSLIVSTSQRAIVAMKGNFQFNENTLAWYLSSGCQGPFISWDKDIKQVLPYLEYKLNIADWSIDSIQKPNMDLPASGTTKMSDFLELYQSEVKKSLKQIIYEYPNGQVLMPLSGGLDSRTLLALSNDANLDDRVTLVNWGAPKAKNVFDDKIAANRVASFYGKPLLNVSLPAEVSCYDEVLDRYIEAGEGQIDNLNAFTDGFKAWEDLFLQGYRVVVRGDIAVTEGVDQNALQLRERMGLTLFADYKNIAEFPLKDYIKLQDDYGSERLKGESLIRWRDRQFAHWAMPTEVAAYTDQISNYMENRAPMLNWSLFKLYMGLPDKEKGNKLHIQKVWEKYDKTGVSRYAVTALNAIDATFDNARGNQYLIDTLAATNKTNLFSSELTENVRKKLMEKKYNTTPSKRQRVLTKFKPVLSSTYALISDNMPIMMKGYLHSKRGVKLPVIVIAYRMVLAQKIVAMYEKDAQQLKEQD